MEIIISIILIAIASVIFYKFYNQKIEIDNKTKEENEQLRLTAKQLQKKSQELNNEYIKAQEQLNALKQNNKEILRKSVELYSLELENKYNEIESDFDNKKEQVEIKYQKMLKQNADSINEETMKLDKIRQTRIAAQKAITREKEIKEQKDFYCLPCSIADRNDIQILERVKKDLNKPRILSMLIWSTFFQKPMNSLCNNVLGVSTVTGIYKITNQISGESYIGQAVDIAKRWKDHAKCGLGIDTPANNKLYKAMQEYGIWNFSWELIEQCPREQLNEKEKYYIDLYMTNDFGFNSNKGVGK